MAVEVVKIDSNATGLKVAEESSLGTLPGSPVWYEMEPNSYSDFGGQLALVARNPINSGRQNKKGVITDLDASGGLNQDLTFSNLSHMWESLFMSTKEEKFYVENTSAGGEIDSVEGGGTDTFTIAADVSSDVFVGDIIWCEGFADDANNGKHIVTAVAGAGPTTLEVLASTLVAEATAPDNASIRVIGFEFVSSDLDVAYSAGSLPTLTTTTKDFTELGLRAGEFIYIGGDGANVFAAAHNNGFARVATIAANILTLDKTSGGADGITEMATEASSTVIEVYFGSTVRNVGTTDTLFSRRSWTIERNLGEPDPVGDTGAFQSELLTGAVVNEFALNVAQADKITTDWTFVATDNVQRDKDDDLLSLGDETATIIEATAYNTSSDFSRIKLAEVRPTQSAVANLAAPSPLFTYVTELTLNVNNNASPNKAVGVLGAFDVTLGNFETSGAITAYFADIASVVAVRNNADVTLDVAIVKDFGSGAIARKAGIVLDVPLIALGDGRANVTQDEAITLPLDTQAAEYENFGHTLLMVEFFYLPDTADT